MSKGILHKFYCSKKWLLFREEVILQNIKKNKYVTCELCKKKLFEKGDIQIHHTPIELTEHNYQDVHISLSHDNVKLVCRACHDKEHDRFRGPKKRKPRTITIVYGPPMSGKKTYVMENMSPGDIVVDMDKLYQAVSFQAMYDKPDNLKYNVFAIRNLLIDNIKTRYGRFRSAWVIGGYPNKVEREKLAQDLGAEVVLMHVPEEECIRRLEGCCDYRRDNKSEWKSFIRSWYENYSK